MLGRITVLVLLAKVGTPGVGAHQRCAATSNIAHFHGDRNVKRRIGINHWRGGATDVAEITKKKKKKKKRKKTTGNNGEGRMEVETRCENVKQRGKFSSSTNCGREGGEVEKTVRGWTGGDTTLNDGAAKPVNEQSSQDAPFFLHMALPSSDGCLEHNTVEVPLSEFESLSITDGCVVRLRGKRRATTVATVVGVNSNIRIDAPNGGSSHTARLSKSAMRNLRVEAGGLVRIERVLGRNANKVGAHSDKDGMPPAALSVAVAPFRDTLPGWMDAVRQQAMLSSYFGRMLERSNGEAFAGAPIKVGDHFTCEAEAPAEEADGGRGGRVVVEWKVLGIMASNIDTVRAKQVEGKDKVGQMAKPANDGDEDPANDVDVGMFVSGSTEISFDTDPLDRTDDDDMMNEVTYEDVGGAEKAVDMVREVVEMPLRHPELFSTVGIPPPHGLLLHGAPGCGKTLLTKAVACETGVFTKIINGPEVMSRKSGESESNLRAAFDDARANAPAIVIIDEVDSIAPKRDKAGGEVEKRMVSQLLTLMDGLKASEAVMVIAATNRPNVLEPALRRFGRFDREIDVGIPDEGGRLDILRIKTKTMRLAEDVDLSQIASDAHGFVGSDIAQLCLEAALQAVREQLGNIDINSDSLDPVMIFTWY